MKIKIENLTDEEVLKEFVKRFECDGAVLLYIDRDQECGFARWKNKAGRQWTKSLFNMLGVNSNQHLK